MPRSRAGSLSFPRSAQELVEYYKAIHRFDQGVGLILEALERQGLDRDTLVLVTSDNGPPFINSKTTLYEAGTCLPLVVRCPGLSRTGIVNPNMISFLDILPPTFLDWAELDSPSKTPDSKSPPRLGRSFLSILDRADNIGPGEWKDHVFCSHTFHEVQNYWPTRVLRTRRFKYHRNIAWRLDFPFASDLYASLTWDGIRQAPMPTMIGNRSLDRYLLRPSEERFDIEQDPDELHNLAEDVEYQAILGKLRGKLERWQLRTKDLWLFRDGVSVVEVQRYFHDGLQLPNRFDMNPASPGVRGLPPMSI